MGLQTGITMQRMDGVIFFVNHSAEAILGLTAAQMRGTTSTDPLWRCYREDGSDFPGTEHPGPTALRTGKSTSGVLSANGARAARTAR